MKQYIENQIMENICSCHMWRNFKQSNNIKKIRKINSYNLNQNERRKEIIIICYQRRKLGFYRIYY